MIVTYLSIKHICYLCDGKEYIMITGKHPVSALMEICNKRHWPSPQFTVVNETGPDHKKNFLFKVGPCRKIFLEEKRIECYRKPLWNVCVCVCLCVSVCVIK